jgi:hypothetical protein
MVGGSSDGWWQTPTMGIISFLSFGVLSNTNHGKSFVFIVIPGLKPRAMNIFSLEKYNPRVKTQGYEYFLSREMGFLLLFGGWWLFGCSVANTMGKKTC